MTKATHASRKQTIECYDRLKQVINKLEDGRCEYLVGHSDHTVAAELGMKHTSVSGVRTEMFGRLFVRRTDQEAEIKELTAALTKTVDALMKNHDDLAVRFNKLVTQLAVNRVADVKHLALPGNGRDVANGQGQLIPTH